VSLEPTGVLEPDARCPSNKEKGLTSTASHETTPSLKAPVQAQGSYQSTLEHKESARGGHKDMSAIPQDTIQTLRRSMRGPVIEPDDPEYDQARSIWDAMVDKRPGDESPDLFWAIRGGGGNFGIATQFVLELHPLGPEVLSGLIVYPFAKAKSLLTQYRDQECISWLRDFFEAAKPYTKGGVYVNFMTEEAALTHDLARDVRPRRGTTL
jgi:FAD/FMN-containing dehydrogenase